MQLIRGTRVRAQSFKNPDALHIANAITRLLLCSLPQNSNIACSVALDALTKPLSS